MRQYSTNINTLMATGELSCFFLIKIEFKDETLYHTTLPYAVNIAGIGDFESDNNLIKVDMPSLSSVVDKSSYSISYADPELEFKERLQAGVIGTKVSIYIGFFNNTESVLGDANPGSPLLNAEDIILVYKGTIDTNGYNVSEEGEIIVSINCASPVANLDQKNTFRTTDSDMRRQNANDSSFELVYEGSASLTLNWGKI